MNKRELRSFFKERVAEISKERKEQAAISACHKLLEIAEDKSLVASFAPLDTEIDIWNFNKLMMAQSRLALPKVSGKDLIFYKVTSIDQLEPSKWKVLEPVDTSSALKVGEISIFIVPGLAFDNQNHRLGKGKGFYDYFISLHNPEKTLGVGYKEQYSKTPLPIELHDKALSEVFLF